jgi:hypothetical protein
MRKVFPPIPVDDMLDPDFCIVQLVHFYNVPFFRSGKAAFMKKMKDAGWDSNDIINADKTALRRSYWNKNHWVEMIMRNPWTFEDKNVKPKKEKELIYAL